MKIAVHHPGARRGYAIPLSLEKENLLFKVFTDCHPEKLVQSTVKQLDIFTGARFNLYTTLMKRHCNDLPKHKICGLGVSGYAYNFLRSSKKSYIEGFKVGLKISELIARKMQPYVEEFDSVYSFALSAHICKKFIPSKSLIMSQMHIPLVSLMDIIEKEEKFHADWFDHSVNHYKNSESLVRNIEKMDLQAADLILAPSEFVRNTLLDRYEFDENRILLSPYTAPMWLNNFPSSVNSSQKYLKNNYDNEKTKILFVGEVGIRKGIPTLLQALSKLSKKKFDARIVGQINIPTKKVKEYSDICTFLGKLSKQDLANQYQWADIFVFPSLGEGSAGVIYEAMAFGLPIITTFSSGSHVRDDIEGYIVPEGNIDALVDRITVYMNDKDCLMRHSLNSWNRVKDFSIEKTSLRFKEVLTRIKEIHF
jgi:glycosyltransferase involved in cell wall biosynthesis